jgi:hypothetical protein
MLRFSADLPDNEGDVFVTCVPEAPFQVLGRIGEDGELYWSGAFFKLPSRKGWDDLKGFPGTIVAGPAAEQLIEDVRRYFAKKAH